MTLKWNEEVAKGKIYVYSLTEKHGKWVLRKSGYYVGSFVKKESGIKVAELIEFG